MKRIVLFGKVIVDCPIWLNPVDYLVKSVLLKSIKLRFQENHESYTYLKGFLKA